MRSAAHAAAGRVDIRTRRGQSTPFMKIDVIATAPFAALAFIRVPFVPLSRAD